MSRRHQAITFNPYDASVAGQIVDAFIEVWPGLLPLRERMVAILWRLLPSIETRSPERERQRSDFSALRDYDRTSRKDAHFRVVRDLVERDLSDAGSTEPACKAIHRVWSTYAHGRDWQRDRVDPPGEAASDLRKQLYLLTVHYNGKVLSEERIKEKLA